MIRALTLAVMLAQAGPCGAKPPPIPTPVPTATPAPTPTPRQMGEIPSCPGYPGWKCADFQSLQPGEAVEWKTTWPASWRRQLTVGQRGAAQLEWFCVWYVPPGGPIDYQAGANTAHADIPGLVGTSRIKIMNCSAPGVVARYKVAARP